MEERIEKKYKTIWINQAASTKWYASTKTDKNKREDTRRISYEIGDFIADPAVIKNKMKGYYKQF